MNCLAWLRLNSSRPAVASPISRIPRRLFQLVLERVRSGMSRQISRFFNAQVATESATFTIFSSVTLSRALIFLLTMGLRLAILQHGHLVRDLFVILLVRIERTRARHPCYRSRSTFFF